MLPVDIEDEDYSVGDLERPVRERAAGKPTTQSVKVPIHLAGSRFDQALAELFPDYSRSRLSAMIKDGAITVNGATAQRKPNYSAVKRFMRRWPRAKRNPRFFRKIFR